MKKNLFAFISILGLTLTAHSFAATIADIAPQQIQQVAEQIAKLKEQAGSFHNNQMVMLGNQSNDLQMAVQYIAEAAARFSDIANKLATYQALQKQIGLKWQPSGITDAPIKDAFVAGMVNGKPLTICRGSFLGASFSSTAQYPGELTSHGCRISFAGYAFSLSSFEVLVGQNPNLRWVPFEQAKQLLDASIQYQRQGPEGVTFDGIKQLVEPVREEQYPLFQIQPEPGKPLPVSGGDQGGHPVYICRATYNGQLTIGKLVTWGGYGSFGQVCDIGVGVKEISISKNFELLLAMPQEN